MAFILVALFALTFAAGCVSENPIKNTDDVQKQVTDISGSVENVHSILEDIDTKIG